MDAWIYLLLVTGFAVMGFRLERLSRRLALLEKNRAASDGTARGAS